MTELRHKRLFLLDMDGTIYVDEQLFDKVPEFLDKVRRLGGMAVFLTNNSYRGVESYIEKMARMGLTVTREDFVTSVDATVDYLKREQSGKKCYVFGTRSFYDQLSSAGIPVTTQREDDVDILLCGFDTELTFQKLEDACILLDRGVDFVATNPDWVCPTWYGSVPDCGSVCEMLFHATGRRPKVIGKPQPAMVELALRRTGFSPKETVVVGDRIYTDIACGVNAGVDTVFVLSGEGVESDIEKYQIRPTWVRPHIRDICRELEERE